MSEERRFVVDAFARKRSSSPFFNVAAKLVSVYGQKPTDDECVAALNAVGWEVHSIRSVEPE